MDAYEIVQKVREQNWKAGGALVMDNDEAEALIQAAIDTAVEAERLACQEAARQLAMTRS
jgi:hypothetical protein